MKRRQKRKIFLLTTLVLALVVLGLWYWNFTQTRSLKVDLRVQPQDVITAPTYLFSFAGTSANHLQAPLGIVADAGNLFVTDSAAGLVFEFKQNGSLVRTFGKGRLTDPLYVAKNPKNGLLYVADRRQRSVVMFNTNGDFVGTFDPKLPKSELPTFDTHGDQWIPIALTFAPDGTMYVIEILNGQRMLIFRPDGTFVRSVGGAGVAAKATDSPGKFQFPNSVKVHGSEVWVVDSNNGRIQVFTLDGTFKRIIPISGLPRGLAFLPPSSQGGPGSGAFAVVDVLASDVSIFPATGASPVTFGERGVGDGQFDLPNDVTVGDKSVIFVTDSKNVRVQAWGWSSKVSPLPHVLPQQPLWCLSLLPLLLLPLLFRKKKFYATADFVVAIADAGALPKMVDRRRAWYVSEEDYETLRSRSEGEIKLSELLKPTEYSLTDAKVLQDRLEIDPQAAAVLAAAQRVKVFCTEDTELRRLARLLEIDVVDVSEYLARFSPKAG